MAGVGLRLTFSSPTSEAAACAANWRGPAKPTADDLKTVTAALARINGGISTREAECAENGYDVEEVFEQLAHEKRRAEGLGLVFADAPQPPQGDGANEDNGQQQAKDANGDG